MNNVNGFDLLINFIFLLIPQLGVILPKAQDLVISFRLGEGKNIPQLHLRAIHIRSETFLLQDKIGQIKNLTVK